jgi:hypothetical protein
LIQAGSAGDGLDHDLPAHFRRQNDQISTQIKMAMTAKMRIKWLVESIRAQMHQRFVTLYQYPDLQDHRKGCVKCISFLPLTANKCPYCGAEQPQADIETRQVDRVWIKRKTDPDLIDQRVYDYIAIHNGTISPSKVTKDLDISKVEFAESIDRLKLLGLLSQ